MEIELRIKILEAKIKEFKIPLKGLEIQADRSRGMENVLLHISTNMRILEANIASWEIELEILEDEIKQA